MANTVYNVVEYQLQDDSTVTLKPATIKTMRKFNTAFMAGPEKIDDKASPAEQEDAGITWLLSLALILLNKQRPDLTLDDAEDILDMDTVYKIIEICAGVKLNDPKLTEMAAATLNQE